MDIMEFNRVREKFRKRIIKQLQNPDMALCPHFAASEGLINMQCPRRFQWVPQNTASLLSQISAQVTAHTPNAHSDYTYINICMPFGTVFSSLGHNSKIPQVPLFLGYLPSGHCSYCGILQCQPLSLTPRYGESFLFFQICSSPHHSILKMCNNSLAVICM